MFFEFSRSFATFIDFAISPSDAIERTRERPTTMLALAVLLLLLVIGALLQSPIAFEQQLVALRHSASTGQLTAAQFSAARTALSAQLLTTSVANGVIYFVIVLFGLLLESGTALVVSTLADCSTGFSRMFSSWVNVGAWTIGGYYVISSLLIRAAFSAHTDATNVDAVFPSVLAIVPRTHGIFVRSMLAALNPFSAAALWLHARIFIDLCKVRPGIAYAVSVFLLLLEVLASGLVSVVFGG